LLDVGLLKAAVVGCGRRGVAAVGVREHAGRERAGVAFG
jgi:hypothetical protein